MLIGFLSDGEDGLGRVDAGFYAGAMARGWRMRRMVNTRKREDGDGSGFAGR